jgi:hypothetical protein
MSRGRVIAAWTTQRIAPPQRMQVSTSTRNTCLSSQPHLDLPWVGPAVGPAAVLSPEPNPNSSWSPAAAWRAKRDGSTPDGTTRARCCE